MHERVLGLEVNTERLLQEFDHQQSAVFAEFLFAVEWVNTSGH